MFLKTSKISVCLFLFFSSILTWAQKPAVVSPAPEYFRNQWVNEQYNKLSLEERIGQLFMVSAYSGGKNHNEAAIKKLIQNKQIGGVIFMQGDPVSQARQTNEFQQMANIPLLIAMDAEWGLGMRLTGVKDLPHQMMLGASQDEDLVYKLGKIIAEQSNRLGVHVDFAPVVDVNNNPANPVINARSFGEDKMNVAKLGIAYMRGLQDNGVMACAKHFPGHGDTDADSHKDLPVIKKSLAALENLEFYPFEQLIKAGVKSMMVAHLEIPALEKGNHIPTSLSKNTITNTLKNKMGFEGLVFTDALDMKGVTKYFQPGEVDVKAFQAGNDVLLFSQNVPLAIQKIKAALQSGAIPMRQLENSVKKILAAKYEAGLAKPVVISTENIVNDLNKEVYRFTREAAEKCITLVKDENDILEKISTDLTSLHYIAVNGSSNSAAFKALKKTNPNITTGSLGSGSSAATVSSLLQAAKNKDAVIVGVHDLSFYPTSGGDYGLDAQQIAFLKKIQAEKNVIIVVFGNAYLLKHFCDVRSVMVCYEDNDIIEQVAAAILTGKLKAKGTLPVTPCEGLQPSEAPASGFVPKDEPATNYKAYTLRKIEFPQDAGFVNPAAIDKLNMFIQRNIADGTFPGCRVFASKDGKIIFDEAYGYYTYAKKKGVELHTLYDVASITKVLATTLSVMRMYEQGKINLDKTLGDYLSWTKGTDKATLKIRDLLLHQAGLTAWIPFYKETLDSNGNLLPEIYSKASSTYYSTPVAKDIFIRNNYKGIIWNTILQSPLENTGRYVYSDLDFYFLAAIVETIAKMPLDEYVMQQFYKPLGLKRICFNPLKKFKLSDIAPTENDLFFRRQVIHGYVHDQGAAMFGGVAGHAGVFAQAEDIAVIFQMLLNGGLYNGKRYFKPATVRLFTSYNSKISRRGLGFDKPNADNENAGPAGNAVSAYTFGHQGFTGTCAWADPATGIIFILLSNRVHPSAENRKIGYHNTRTVAQDYIYEAFGFSDNKSRVALYKKQVNH